MSLTKHPEASLKELWFISFPLVLSSLSFCMMIFVDRWQLAHFSTSALNASVAAATLGWSFVFSFATLTGISEVFVAQNNGAKKFDQLGPPVWQTIYLSALSLFFFVPLAYFGPSFFFSKAQLYERQYLEIMVLFGPFFALSYALTGFFVGQGKIKLVTTLALIANMLNAFLDYVLIFGIKGFIPSYGVQGAAIATSFSCGFQALILFCVFLSPGNRLRFNTACCKLNPPLFLSCLKVGLPLAFFVGIEVFGWSLFYKMMQIKGERYMTIAGICQSLALLFFFVPEGINKGMIAVCGNLIGASKQSLLGKVLRQGIILNTLFLLIILGFYALFQGLIIASFLPETTLREELSSPLSIALLLSMFYVFFEGLRFVFAAILTASKDTLFLFIAGGCTIWGFMVVPTYFFVLQGTESEVFSIGIWVFYASFATIIYSLRVFYKGRTQMKERLT